MLATQSMGSYPGQHDRLRSPFGYVLSNVNGVGLPPFITPGPPPGQPLLNDNESQHLSSFFDGFESNILHPNTQTFDGQHHQDDRHLDYDAPPVFVGSETHLEYGSSVNPRRLQPGTFAQNMMGQNMSMLSHEGTFDHGLESGIPSYMDPSFEHGQLHSQFQDMQAPPQLHQSYSQQYEPGMMQPFVNGRPAVRWGSDGHFQQSGYDAPLHQQEPDMINNLDWIEPQSSANNTAPNSRPITQPSSPNMSRKRKFADELFPPRSTANTYDHGAVTGSVNSAGISKTGTSKAVVTKRKKSTVKEEEAASQTSTSPAPWPSNKARPVSKPPVPKKTSNRGKWKVEEGTPDNVQGSASASKTAPKLSSKSKATKKTPTKSAARSLARSSTTPATGRTPLTSDQKKANHTNSEQRRRDQTGQAYARMYDLVPQLAETGKMSTTRKLEVVVNKLRDLQDGNAQLRANLGL